MQNTTFVGNLTADPELRHSANGNPRATFSVAINEGQDDNEVTHFLNFTAFGTLGENVANSLRRGQRVIVVGRASTYTKAVEIDGEPKNLTMTNFIANFVGPDLRWATAEVTKVARASAAAEAADDDEATKAPRAPRAKAASKKAASKKAAAPVADDDEPF